MNMLKHTLLIVVIIIGCDRNSDRVVQLFDNTFYARVPEQMVECEEFDSIPDFLSMLYHFKTKESHLFKGDSSYFSAMIIDTPCDDSITSYLEYSSEFADVFSLAYPTIVFSEGGDGGNDSFNYHYQSFKLEFSFATYSIFYAISSLNGNLLYINYLEQSENIEEVRKRGEEIMKSMK